jgi:hypothetical protein
VNPNCRSGSGLTHGATDGGEWEVLGAIPCGVIPGLGNVELLGRRLTAVEGLDQVASCDVKVVMEPAWSPEKMTDEARDHLGIF